MLTREGLKITVAASLKSDELGQDFESFLWLESLSKLAVSTYWQLF